MMMPVFSRGLRDMRRFSYSQLRHIYSETGEWKKKLSKTILEDIERVWKDKVLSASSGVRPSESASAGPSTLVKTCEDKVYVLSMFPYPSGDLHMGHVRVYTISDVLARFHRLSGRKVVHPIGWDAFGLPAENAAIERGLAPSTWTYSNIARMKEQLKDLRISFDWDREFATCDPKYYRWTQSIFLRLLRAGLAYSMEAAVNWDPVDQTVLADEQIDANGCSWRSGAKVERKFLKQWYIRATAYSKPLLDGLETLDPDSCRGFANLQKTWIGKLSGVKIFLKLQPGEETIPIYMDNPELLFGVAFLQVSPEHALAHKYTCELETGALKGIHAIHPLTDRKLPIIVKASCKMSQKNMSRLGIPSVHEEDRVIAESLSTISWSTVLTPEGLLMQSGFLDGLNQPEARQLICQHLQTQKLGGYPASAELNDWLISRQRYWGTPIPIIHCSSCGTVPVPEQDLPVVLPDVAEFSRQGGNPLLHQKEWLHVSCPKCGCSAQRESDTMDTFVDSSWYFLRFADPNNAREVFDSRLANQLMPVDVYVGGAEHAILHMYYARFMTYFLADQGLISYAEPFTTQLALGTVHSESYRVTRTGKYIPRNRVKLVGDSILERGTDEPVTVTMEKMSKSKYNGVSPQEVLKQHGVDQMRLYMLAHDAPRAVKYWDVELAKKLSTNSPKAISIPRWLHVLWHTVAIIRERRQLLTSQISSPLDAAVETSIHEVRNRTVRQVSLHLGVTFNFHDALYSMSTALSDIDKQPLDVKICSEAYERCFCDLLITLHPFAPHFTAELWEGMRTAPRLLGNTHYDWDSDIFCQKWPEVDCEYPLALMVLALVHKPIGEPGAEQFETQTISLETIQLPRHVIEDLTLDRALRITKFSPPDHPVDFTAREPALVIRKNCGATLTLDYRHQQMMGNLKEMLER